MRRKNAGCVKKLIYTKFTQCKFGAKKWKLRLNQALEFTTPCKLACKCGIYHLCPWFPPNLQFFLPWIQFSCRWSSFYTTFFGNAGKYTLAKREEVYMNGLQSTIGMYHGFCELFRVLWSSQGRSQDFFRGAHNFPYAHVIFSSDSYKL